MNYYDIFKIYVSYYILHMIILHYNKCKTSNIITINYN